ncbi:MAG TPA: Na/Pi symporter [Thermoguttaceae bacterium]|nr:Na/Pi symporter [Thermoguttaceae bacterium]
MGNSVQSWRTGGLRRLGAFLLALYVFLAGIELFGSSFKILGKDTADSLFCGLGNPFAGLAVGIIATAILQSSSATTSTVVAMVGANGLSLACAIPIVMGANIGTAITCALVSLGHITQSAQFQRAFAGAAMHGFINLLTVVVLLPLELATHFMERGAEWMLRVLPVQQTGGSFHSPVKTVVGWLAGTIEWIFRKMLGLGGEENTIALAVILAVVALGMVLAALIVITKNMKKLMADRIEEWLNRVLSRSGLLGLVIGAFVTMIVQSSSITTSLLIPMFGAGILALEAGFPIMLGANIGTTITALLAASVVGPLGLTIALVHVQFNVLGAMLFFPVKRMRRVPIFFAERLAALAVRNRLWVVLYMLGTFIVLPLLGILIWK